MDLSNENVIHIKKEGQEFLQFKKLLEYSDIISHAYSLGVDKNYRTFRPNKTSLPKEEYEKNIGNYKSFCEANDLNYKNIIKASQAHTDIVKKVVEKEDLLNNIDLHFHFLDAIWYNLLGIPLFIFIVISIIMIVKDLYLNRFSYIPSLLYFFEKHYIFIIILLVISFTFNNVK